MSQLDSYESAMIGKVVICSSFELAMIEFCSLTGGLLLGFGLALPGWRGDVTLYLGLALCCVPLGIIRIIRTEMTRDDGEDPEPDY